MKLIEIKTIQIVSNGCLYFFSTNFTHNKQFIFHQKDQKNFHLNKKKINKNEIGSEDFFGYKNKFLT